MSLRSLVSVIWLPSRVLQKDKRQTLSTRCAERWSSPHHQASLRNCGLVKKPLTWA